ncbi:TetR/AcrR family transcriptional regulator [Corynebacterium pygosceleis]|uniref:TetR/AcrR family transcriptional regulator n=1 Tax=Corynebacterium pygosceleis TaxID=2800406 RepID=UPI0020037989|nr:TetR/AcrR family transcriptional regulator [Corynebacterium pygosceleis]MCL0120757.1 TetR/AcrR family transcriptional regulator [Corynebacterium pygosceleis]
MRSNPETRAKLVSATREVIVAHGFEGCTLERICRTAGFTRGAFYSNFADKDALFTLVVRDEYARVIELLDAVTREWVAAFHPGARHTSCSDEVAAEKLTDALLRTRERLGLDRDFLVLHNELLARAAREPEWAMQFMEINRDFVMGVGRALELMLAEVDRVPVKRTEAIAQAVIGITMRYTGVSVWRDRLENVEGEHRRRGTMLELDDILDLLLTLLMASSAPAGGPASE